MRSTVSAWSIRRPLPAVVLSIVLAGLGWISFGSLPVVRPTPAEIPAVSISVALSGAAPSDLVAEVSKPVEDAVSSVDGVRHVLSSITDGMSVTTVQFRLGTDTDRALNDVRDAVGRLRMSLPQGIVAPLIQRVDVVGMPIVTYTVAASDKSAEQLSIFVDDVVARALRGVPGVGRLERIGGVDREISVALDPDKLQAMGLAASDVSHQLRGTRADMLGGLAEIGGREQPVRVLAASSTVSGVASSMITLPSGGQVRLDDLGTVTSGFVESKTFVRIDGRSVVGFDVLRSRSASDAAVVSSVASKVAEIRAAYPQVEISLADTSADGTSGQTEAKIWPVFLGLVLAIALMLVVLRDLRATLIAAAAIGLSVLPAFWVMHVLGFSLGTGSLLAIVMCLGILVDDAVVEVENIERHLAMGASPVQASVVSAREIEPTVIATSFVLVAVFVAIGLMGKAHGFLQFGVTAALLTTFSLLATRLVTPMLAACLLKPRPRPLTDKPPNPLLRRYIGVARWASGHPYPIVAIGLVWLLVSVFCAGFLPTGSRAADDNGRSLLVIELPAGAPLAATENVTEDVVRRLLARPEVKSVMVDGGRVPLATPEARKATMIVTFKPMSERALSQRQLQTAISEDLETIPDIRHWFLDAKGLRPVALAVTGQDATTVGNVAAELAGQMQRLSVVANIVSAASLHRPELVIRRHLDLAARLGISTEDLSETLRMATVGDVVPSLIRPTAGERAIPIRVQLDVTLRRNLPMLEQLRVRRPGNNEAVPLASVASLSFDEGPIAITRLDRQALAAVGADLVGDATIGDAMAAVSTLPIMKSLPAGISVKPANEAVETDKSTDGFASTIGAGLLLAVVLSILLCDGLLQPITVLVVAPLAAACALVGPLVTHIPFGVPVLTGLLMVMCIATKQAVLLVQTTTRALKRIPRELATREAGLKRARPIVLTLVAVALAMLPSLVFPSAGGGIGSSLAITVIVGLLVSGLVVLVFVPAMVVVIDDMCRLCHRLCAKLIPPRRRAAG